jgi:hypothetical protein
MRMGGGFASRESWEVPKPITTIWLKWEYAYVFWKVIETHCTQNNNLNYKYFLNDLLKPLSPILQCTCMWKFMNFFELKITPNLQES